MALQVTKTDSGVTFPVKVVPNSSRTAISQLLGSALKVTIAAAPEKHKANKELIKLLAHTLGRPKSDLQIISGSTNAHKEIFIKNMTSRQLLDGLARYLS